MSMRLRVTCLHWRDVVRWALGLGWDLRSLRDCEFPPYTLALLIDDAAETRKSKMQESGTRKKNPLSPAKSLPCSLLIKFNSGKEKCCRAGPEG